MFEGGIDEEGESAGIVVERGPLREDQTFVELAEQRVVGEHLRDAYGALGEAPVVHRELGRAGQEYCDEGQVHELDGLTFEALGTAERAWKAPCVVTDAHAAQLAEADQADQADLADDEGVVLHSLFTVRDAVAACC
jgi:hypothetical protein